MVRQPGSHIEVYLGMLGVLGVQQQQQQWVGVHSSYAGSIGMGKVHSVTK